ncbi:MAG TPA: isocitrate lyase/phosphoenolpyruvate mutase family protein [Chitinophagaceae bacterium]|nr:isocitrate lyase/phosphoenolpyruvate mutase family protein [Chitinophagaceae bacterium]
MSVNFEKFKALHQAKELFVLPNAWDAKSATLFQENHFQAIGTSSAAVAASLGYQDGENMSFSEYLFVIQRILATVKIPVTVDIEMGYGKTKEQILENIIRLTDLGIVGINIEDSVIHGSKRALQNTRDFAAVIEYIKNRLISTNRPLFINLRCDTYILNVADKTKETTQRLQVYEAAGADGIFLPFICEEKDIAQAVSNTNLPVNVMCVPGLPDFNTLQELGVRRVSMGPFLFNKAYKTAGELSGKVLTQKNFSSIL